MAISGANTDSQGQAVLVGTPVIYNTPAPASYTGSQTYLAADILGGTIVHGNAGAANGTLPTAALLAGAIKGILGMQMAIGSMVECLIVNGGTAAITLLAGSGGTFDGNQGAASQVIAINASKYVQLRFTNITVGSETYNIYS